MTSVGSGCQSEFLAFSRLIGSRSSIAKCTHGQFDDARTETAILQSRTISASDLNSLTGMRSAEMAECGSANAAEISLDRSDLPAADELLLTQFGECAEFG